MLGGAMRYKLHMSRLEYIAALFPLVDSTSRLLRHPPAQHAGWAMVQAYVFPLLLLSTPLIIWLRHSYSYVELAPSIVEYRQILQHRTIPYVEIERIKFGERMNGGMGWDKIIEVYGFGIKKLVLKLDQPDVFLRELRQYAPNARIEDLVTP
jgi:hypothetical protein